MVNHIPYSILVSVATDLSENYELWRGTADDQDWIQTIENIHIYKRQHSDGLDRSRVRMEVSKIPEDMRKDWPMDDADAVGLEMDKLGVLTLIIEGDALVWVKTMVDAIRNL